MPSIFDPLSELALLEAEVDRRRLTSYRAFVPWAWRLIDPTPFRPTWHVDAVADHLQAVTDGQVSRLIINIPPGCAKSLLTSVLWPAYEWGPAKRPALRHVTVSHSGTSVVPSVRDARRSRNLMMSDEYQALWGSAWSFTSDQNQKSYYENDRKGFRVATSILSTTGLRADRIIIDDPLKLNERLSVVALDTVIGAWNDALRSRLDQPDLERPDPSAVVLIMQRLNERDLAGYFIERQREDGWVVLRLPRLYEPEHRCRTFVGGRPFFEDPRAEDGEPLTAFKSRDAIEKDRAESGTWRFSAEEQQRPVPLSGGMIQLAWVQRWTTLPGSWDALIQSWDCAFKANEDNSFVVGQVWGRRLGRAYLLAQVRGHWDLPGTLKQVVQLTERFPTAHVKLVEDKANGPAVVQVLRDKLPGMIAVNVKDSKEARLAAVAPFFESGNVFVPEDDHAAWVPEYVAELTTFPKARHDDQVDATSLGLARLMADLRVNADDLHGYIADTLEAGSSVATFGGSIYASGGGLSQTFRDAFG